MVPVYRVTEAGALRVCRERLRRPFPGVVARGARRSALPRCTGPRGVASSARQTGDVRACATGEGTSGISALHAAARHCRSRRENRSSLVPRASSRAPQRASSRRSDETRDRVAAKRGSAQRIATRRAWTPQRPPSSAAFLKVRNPGGDWKRSKTIGAPRPFFVGSPSLSRRSPSGSMLRSHPEKCQTVPLLSLGVAYADVARRNVESSASEASIARA